MLGSNGEIRWQVQKNKNQNCQCTKYTKITKAMEMVATSKMRKTQDRMAASRPYSETIRNVISHVSKASIGLNIRS
ncbi:hypothetical protein CHBNII3_05180 [Haemophilus influenzae]|nr:hypothetical protein CHBNII3_05180 [Haemophilus influenzae]